MPVLKRLDPDDALSWTLWPVLEARVRKTSETLATDTPPDAIIRYMRGLWGASPLLFRAWVALEDEWKVVGHAVAWVLNEWGRTQVLIHQVVADEHVSMAEIKDGFFASVSEWITSLDRLAAQGQMAPVKDVVMWTARPEAMVRYLGYGATKTISQVRLSADSFRHAPMPQGDNGNGRGRTD